jgi:hypothetical protein
MTIFIETILQKIRENETQFLAAYNNYKLCYIHFNVKEENSDIQCSNIIKKPKSTCNDCLKESEDIIIRSLTEIQNIQNEIKNESANLGKPPVAKQQGVTQKQKDDLTKVVNQYHTTRGSLMDSVELYKTYRIYLISEVVKLLLILAIILYLLKTTKGIKTMTYISVIVYVSLSSLNVFYRGYVLFTFSVLSFFVFIVVAIMNINDISINYQNISNNTTETLSNISSEFKKDVNVL